MQTVETTTSSPNSTNAVLAEVLLRDCTIRPKIIVGQKVPNEVSFNYEGGGGWTNMGSFRMDYLVKKHLKNITGLDYEFSEICRDENELKAFELAIEENCKSLGFKVTEYVS